MIGFRAEDGDEVEAAPEVVDGHASERNLSPSEHCDLFVLLCERLRAMGAVEVRAEQFRASFAAPAAVGKLDAAPVLAKLREQRKPKQEEPPPERVLDTDTPDDVARRQRYIEVQRAIGGGG